MSTSAGTRSSTNASKAPRVAGDWAARATAEQALSQAQARLKSAQEARTRAETAVSRAQKNERGAMDTAGRDLAQAGRRGNEQQLQRAIQNERSAQDALAAAQRAASGARGASKQQAAPRVGGPPSKQTLDTQRWANRAAKLPDAQRARVNQLTAQIHLSQNGLLNSKSAEETAAHKASIKRAQDERAQIMRSVPGAKPRAPRSARPKSPKAQ
jgi:hypothetical protein